MIQCRNDPDVESPPSLRTSIGLARFIGERASRMKKDVDNALIASCARLILREGIEMKPGRDVDAFLKKLLTRVVGVA